MTTNITITNFKGSVGKNTLIMTARFRKPILGILPVASGGAQWEKGILDHWKITLDQSTDTKELGGVVLPRLPYSKSLIRGAWASAPFPEHLVPIFDTIYTRAFGRSAFPVQSNIEVLEVVNG